MGYYGGLDELENDKKTTLPNNKFDVVQVVSLHILLQMLKFHNMFKSIEHVKILHMLKINILFQNVKL